MNMSRQGKNKAQKQVQKVRQKIKIAIMFPLIIYLQRIT